MGVSPRALPSEYRMKAALSIRLLDRRRICKGTSWTREDFEFILTLVEEQEEVFNKVNASTALHRVARLATQRVPGQTKPSVERSTLFADARFQTLMSMVDRMAGEMSMQGVSNALWALARLDYPADETLREALANRAASQAAFAESKNLSTTLWALVLALLGHKPRSKPRGDRGSRAHRRGRFQSAGSHQHALGVRALGAVPRRHPTGRCQSCRPVARPSGEHDAKLPRISSPTCPGRWPCWIVLRHPRFWNTSCKRWRPIRASSTARRSRTCSGRSASWARRQSPLASAISANFFANPVDARAIGSSRTHGRCGRALGVRIDSASSRTPKTRRDS